MELNQLRTFLLVSKHRSFSKAALQLHLTQPAITLQMKNLEEELGELLIDRQGRTLSLTPAGEVFLAYAQQLLNLTDEAVTAIRQFSEERGRLVIGAGTTNTIYRLPEILSQYHQAFPQVEIEIRDGDSAVVTRLVYENAVDLGLITTIDTPANNLKIIPLFEDQIVLAGPTSFPGTITLTELNEVPLIHYRAGAGFRRFLDDQFRKYRLTPNSSMELESISAIIRFVQNGLGLSFLPEIAIREDLEQKKLKQITIEAWDQMKRHTYLIYRADKYLTWPIKALLQQLQQILPGNIFQC